MLRPVLLALLVMLVTVPAAAMPLLHGQADRSPVAAMHCHEAAPGKSHLPDSAPMAQHDGICCAAFYGATGLALSPMPPATAAPGPLVPAGLPRPRAGPDAPPPKA